MDTKVWMVQRQQGKGAPAPQCPPSQTVCLMLGASGRRAPLWARPPFPGLFAFLRQVQVGSHLKGSDPSWSWVFQVQGS